MKTYQKVIVALVICGVGFAAFQWWRKGKSNEIVEEKELIPVEAVIAKTGSIMRRYTTAGNLSAVQWVNLHSEVDGKIQKIFFKEGEKVAEGEPLFKIDEATYKAKVRELEARVALAKVEYERAVKLQEKKFQSEAEKDRKYAELQIHEANLDEAKIKLDNTIIKAPFAGVMGLSEVSVGALVSPQVELVNIVDLDPINVDFNVPESYLSSLHVDDVVDVTIEDFDILPLDAKIVAISPEIDEQTRTVPIRAQLPNKEMNYRPGEYARVVVEAGEIKNAVLVPESAIEREGEEDYVMLVVDNVAVRSTVSIGMRNGNAAEITHGVKAGDVVVSAGQFKLRDGDEVTVVNMDELQKSKDN